MLLWWTYFHYGAPAVRHSLEHDPAQSRIVTDVFSYAHLGYVIAIVEVAVGLKKLLAHPLDVPHSLPELLLAPGVALYLWGFCYARWRMFGAATLQRFTAALTCCAVAAAAVVLPMRRPRCWSQSCSRSTGSRPGSSVRTGPCRCCAHPDADRRRAARGSAVRVGPDHRQNRMPGDARLAPDHCAGADVRPSRAGRTSFAGRIPRSSVVRWDFLERGLKGHGGFERSR